MSDKKYYWLKLKKDFFKRHDIQIIEAMPNGKDYILFYLKMLVESVDHDGNLRFNDTIPYNETMLSTITNTNIDIVRSAMKVFTDLKMIEVLEDSTIFMAEVERMLGTETYWAEQKRKQKQNKLLEGGKCPENVQTISNESNQEIDIDIEKEQEIDIKKKSIDDFFESIWKLYPNKKGKAQISLTVKTKLLKVGFDKLSNCIDRYKKTKPSWQQYQNGSTFFNSGYVDYLDENFCEVEEPADCYRRVD